MRTWRVDYEADSGDWLVVQNGMNTVYARCASQEMAINVCWALNFQAHSDPTKVTVVKGGHDDR